MTSRKTPPANLAPGSGTDGTDGTDVGNCEQDAATATLQAPVKVTPSADYPAPAEPASARREVRKSGKEGTDRHRGAAGRPPAVIDRRILEAVLKLHAEGHPWPRLRQLLKPVCRRYGGPRSLSVEQTRRLAAKAARVLGVELKKRPAGRPWGYYRQIKKGGGA